MSRGVRPCEFVTWQGVCGLVAPAYEDGKDYCLFHYNHLEWLRGIAKQKPIGRVRKRAN